jgi:hypothetical protein
VLAKCGIAVLMCGMFGVEGTVLLDRLRQDGRLPAPFAARVPSWVASSTWSTSRSTSSPTWSERDAGRQAPELIVSVAVCGVLSAEVPT